MIKNKLIRNYRQNLTKLTQSLLVLISRSVSLLPNFSPVGAYGFFGQNLIGYYGGIVVFDWVRSGFYPGFIFTHIGFLSYYLWGQIAKSLHSKLNWKRSLLFLAAASFSFFLISNFGVWLYWYPRTLEGLISCYLAAVPFYRNTLIGDAFFGGAFLLAKQAAIMFKNQKSTLPETISQTINYHLKKTR